MCKEKMCACNKQIVWFFETPTIIAREDCEITFYYDVEHCPHCHKEVSIFEKVSKD